MISFIEGKIIKKEPNYVVILNNGIGYEIYTSFITYKKLKNEGEIDTLFVFTLHKEDILKLFGFKSEEERNMFKLLLSVSGVGPQLALTILSNIDTKNLQEAVLMQNPKILTSISGIGLKRAEKLIFDLKEKIKKFLKESENSLKGDNFYKLKNDALIALENLGYSQKEIMEALKEISIDSKTTIEDLIKEALKKLSKL